MMKISIYQIKKRAYMVLPAYTLSHSKLLKMICISTFPLNDLSFNLSF